ncbi:aspartate aminotransferase family protein [Sphingobacterium arenae]|uniref:Aspartate aminotransferase family protein n=1 Tax=Sphingobacterium arenae TaxID=1280598 RepID=A0ABR7Y5I3_9SPHI|nr:aspartate aminotransferase family protein [Sphingobacterium arenae]MBD1426552.1 aspartate aminotransferase family protein [Sphingobacterium arenae]
MKLFDVYKRIDTEIIKGKERFVWDAKGNQYLDMFGGHAVISIGHLHPHYMDRLTSQLKHLGFYSNSVRLSLQEQLAEKLGKVCGKENHQLFLCNSGAEANENALKLASFANGRKKIIAFTGAFHGRTSLAVATTDNPAIIAPVNETDNVIFLSHNDIQALEETFAKYKEQISSVIIEGIQGVSGIYISKPEFLQRIRTLCNAYGAYFIGDAVQCGYGRTGKFFAHDYACVEADIYTVAKGMGNGFPIAGLIISPKFTAKTGMLGTTFGGNPLACASALAVLEIFEEENLIENALHIGDYLKTELEKFTEIKEVRGKGLMIGIELLGRYKDLRKNLINKHRIITGEAGQHVIRLLPALNITKGEADLFLTAIKSELK